MEKKTDEVGFLKKNGIAIATVVVSMITAGTAVQGCYREETRANENATRLEEVEEQVKLLRADLEFKSAEVERQKRELKRSLDTYAIYYREKVKNAQAAIDVYTDFDTEVNRKELEAEFDRQHRELLDEAKIKLEALVDHVMKYRPVLAALEETLNGRITALEEQLSDNNVNGFLSRFGVLRENVESDLVRLKQELDKAADL